MTESLEVQAISRMVAAAEALGLGDHPATEEVKKMLVAHDLHGPLNGGALIWWRENKDLPEVDWPVGCCIGNDMNSPEHCMCWEPVFDLEQAEPSGTVTSWEKCDSQVGLCHDCAYRPGSPERSDAWEEEALLDLTRSKNQAFFCHEGMRRPVLWRHPDGREVPGSPKDYKPPYVDGVPYRADGRPGLLCGGWWALRDKFRKDVAARPSWLQDLVDMQMAGQILPGGMVWVDELPARRAHGRPPRTRAEFVAGDVEPIEGCERGGARLALVAGPDPRRIHDAPLMPVQTRIEVAAVLKRHPHRWARVFDGGNDHAGAIATWFRNQRSGGLIDAEVRRHGPTVAVYARHVQFDVLTTEAREEAL